MPKPTQSPPHPQTANQGRRRLGKRVWLGVAALVASLVGGAITSYYIWGKEPDEPRPDVAKALALVDDKELDSARHLAERVRRLPDAHSEEIRDAAYVLGAAAIHDANQLSGESRARRFELAARYLGESREQGFPPGYEAEGAFLLGLSLVMTGQIAEAKPFLQEALSAGCSNPGEAHRLLARVYYHQPRRELDGALAQIDAFLAEPDLSEADRQAGILDRARIQWAAHDVGACQSTLEMIPADSEMTPRANVLRAACLLDAGPDASPPTPQAIASAQVLLEGVLALPGLENPAAPSAMLWSARGMRLLDNRREAIATWEGLIRVHLEQPEGLVAALDLAAELRGSNRHREAVELWQAAVQAHGTRAALQNPWLALGEYRNRLLADYSEDVSAGRFADALILARQMEQISTTAHSLELVAAAHRAWAVALADELAASPWERARELERSSRGHYRSAAEVYAELARLRFATAEYPHDTWAAAQCAWLGHDFRAAAERFGEYLATDDRQYRPQALVRLGETLLEQNQAQSAEARFQECLEFFPQDPLGYEARLLLARSAAERGDPEAARANYLELLEGSVLTPQSREWREALVGLGRLAFEEGKYLEAAGRLIEAAERYPEDPRTPENRYLVGKSLAGEARGLAGSAAADAPIGQQLQTAQRINSHWQEALANFDRVIADLEQERQSSEGDPARELLFRNCLFARGQALVELGRYREAIQAYTHASHRYRRSPEVLEAFVRMADCYRRLQMPDDARLTIEQAKAALERIAVDAPFLEVTNRTREEWTQWLDRFSVL